MSTRFWPVPGVLTALVMTGAAGADNLDRALLKETPRLMRELTKNYKTPQTIAVLPFKVQKGTRPASYFAAPLATGITERLSVSIVMSMKPAGGEPWGVIENAPAVLSAANIPNPIKSAAARKRAFALNCYLMWGNKTYKPTVFLTGLISNTADRKKTTIEVSYFDANSRADADSGEVKLTKLGTISVDTDRALLRDLGYHYAL